MRIFALGTENDAFDNLPSYSVIGANTIDANKVGESLAFGGNSGLFAQLLQTTGVQQVACRSDKEFDLTLEMKDETVAHEAKMGEVIGNTMGSGFSSRPTQQQ